jgi:ribosome biogenesis GTPase
MAFFYFWRNFPVPNREEKQWRHHEENKTLRKVRKQIKRNRKTKRVRRKDWMPDSYEDLDALYDLDTPTEERIMPRGERERRQAALDDALARLREKEQSEKAVDDRQVPGLRGMVVEVSSSLCRVQVDGGTLLCGIRGSLSAEDSGYTNVVAVGDQVLLTKEGDDQGVVETVLPRRSILARPDPFYTHLQQVIVANADQLLIVAAWRDPSFWPELVDRYLIAAGRSNLAPVLCVNKIDLADRLADCQAALQPYRDVGYRIVLTSAIQGAGIDRLRAELDGRTTVLAGLSGVGKSSLLNAVESGLELRTKTVSEHSHSGRHTTTQVNLFKLQNGGCVIDTPGIREFGLAGLRRGELIRFYPEIAALDGRCRFRDCSHTHEPGCAIKDAVQEGRLSKMRYQSYLGIYQALPASRAEEQKQAQNRRIR